MAQSRGEQGNRPKSWKAQPTRPKTKGGVYGLFSVDQIGWFTAVGLRDCPRTHTLGKHVMLFRNSTKWFTI